MQKQNGWKTAMWMVLGILDLIVLCHLAVAMYIYNKYILGHGNRYMQPETDEAPVTPAIESKPARAA